jgi:hypothetical protein
LGVLACTVVAPLLAIFCSTGEVGKQVSCGASAANPASPQASISALPHEGHQSRAVEPGDLLRGRNLAASTPGPIRATVYETEAPPRAAEDHGRLVPVSGPEASGGTRSNPSPIPEPQRTATDHFTAIQQRLRRLGATYYRLETWGERGDQFRFQCRVVFGEAPGLVRDFEAVDREPVQAMAKVLWQVQTWRSPAGRN